MDVMNTIESRTGIVNQSDDKIYNFLSDFTNLSSLIPSGKLKSWEATPDSCQFEVDGLGAAGLKIIQKSPNNLIRVSSSGSTPISFEFSIHIKHRDPHSSDVQIRIDPSVNPFMMAIIKAPLRNFADMLIDQLEKMEFQK